MLAKEYRLTKTKEFENVFDNGKAFFTKILGIKYAKNNLDVTRFGILISAKISKKAVVRNKIKRRLREIIRLHFDKIKQGYDIVVLTRSGIKESDYEKLERDMGYAMSRANLLKKL